MQRFILLAALWGATTALGENQMAAEGKRLFKETKYKAAAEAFRRAYDEERSPVHLFDAARAYEHAGELGLASDFYEKYVEIPIDYLMPELMRRAKEGQARIHARAARSKDDKAGRERDKQLLEQDLQMEAEAQAAAEADRARAQRREQEALEKARKESEAKRLNERRLFAYVSGGVAIGGLGAALGLGLAANGNRRAFADAETLAGKRYYQSATQATAAASDVSLVVAVAASVAAAILFPKGDEAPKSVTVVLAPVAGGAMASLGMEF